jgi:hypothetical protein
MPDVVRTLTIRSKTEGVQQTTADVKNLTAAYAGTATVTDVVTRSQLSMEQALARAQRQVTSSTQAQQALTKSYGAATDGVESFGKSLADHAADFLNNINHLKLIALGAYALLPAFRSFVNIGQAFGLVAGQLGTMATILSRVVSVASPALSFFARIGIPIGAAVAAFEAFNFVVNQGSELLAKYGDRTKELFPDLDKDLEKLTRFQQETLSSDQVQLASELGGRLAAAKREISEFLRVQIDTQTSALQLQNVWVVIVETIGRGATALSNFKTSSEQAAQAFGNSPIWSKIFGTGGGGLGILPGTLTPVAGPGAAAAPTGPTQFELSRARENLAVGLGGGTSFAARFGAVTDKPKDATEVAKQTGEFERLADSISRATAAQEANALSEGRGAEEVARLRTEFRLMEAAQEDIIKNGGNIDDYSDKIKKLADRSGAAAAALEKAKLASDINFGRQTALLSPEDVQIAERLRTLYGDDVPAALNSTYAAQLRLNDQLKQTRSAADEFVSSASTNLTSGLADITTGAKNASDAFKDLGTSVLRSLEEMIIKMTITIPIARALQQTIGSFLPGAGATGPSPIGYTPPVPGLHGGGVVGMESTFTRYVHPAYFENAPRFHGGLMPDEMPAILQRGESVLTAGQMAALGGAVRSGVQVNVGIQNYAGAKVSVDQKKNESGGVDLTFIVEQAEAQIAGKVADGRGALNNALTSRYGLRPSFSG